VGTWVTKFLAQLITDKMESGLLVLILGLDISICPPLPENFSADALFQLHNNFLQVCLKEATLLHRTTFLETQISNSSIF